MPYPAPVIPAQAGIQTQETLDSRVCGNDEAKSLSPEAQAVLNAGRGLWQAYFTQTAPHHVREELKLNRADVGWYQIRHALKKRNEAGDSAPVDFSAFESAYKQLSEKLVPQVYELGFLKP